MNTILGFCCVNRNKDDSLSERYSQTNNLSDYIISTRPHLPRVLQLFNLIERHFRTGLKKVGKPLDELIDELDRESIPYDNDQIACKFVPQAAVERIFDIDNEDDQETQVLSSCLRMQFFKEDSQDMYDFDKLALFCILYCDADLQQKGEMLFFLMANQDENVITNKSSKVKHIFSYLTVIACVITAEFIHSVLKDEFQSMEEEQEFSSLYFLYSSDFSTLNMFTAYWKIQKLFPTGLRNQSMNPQNFTNLLRQQDHIFVNSESIRKEYTHYVLIQRQAILDNVHKGANNESFNQSQNTTHNENKLNDQSRQSWRNSDVFQNLKKGEKSKSGKLSDRDQQILYNKENRRDGATPMRDSIAGYKERYSQHIDQTSKRSKKSKLDKKKKKKSKKRDYDDDEIDEQQEQQKRQELLDQSLQQLDDDQMMGQIEEEQNSEDEDQEFGNLKKNYEEEIAFGKKPSKKNKTELQETFGTEYMATQMANKEKNSPSKTSPKKKNKNKKHKTQYDEYGSEDGYGEEKKSADTSNQLLQDFGNTPEERKENKKKFTRDKKAEKRDMNASMNSYRSRYSHVSNTTLSKYSDMNQSQRRTKNVSIESFMKELVGDQFYQLVFLLSIENQADFEEDGRFSNRNATQNSKILRSREARFAENEKALLSPNGFKLKFPANMSKFPTHLREIFEYFKQIIKAEDLVLLQKGEISDENLINLYFKVLEKINFVLQKVQEFFKTQGTTPGGRGTIGSEAVTAEKVLYGNANFVKKLRAINTEDFDSDGGMSNVSGNQKAETTKVLTSINESDVVLIPFFPEKTADGEYVEGQSTILVSLFPGGLKADLFERAGRMSVDTNATRPASDPMAEMISDEVVNIFENVAKFTGSSFEEDDVDGGIQSVCVSCEEDYMIAMAYIADCYTFNRNIDLETFNVTRERNKMVDLLLALLKFK